MADIIKIKRGYTAGVEPLGLTLGELAANLSDQKLFIGGTFGNAIPLIGGSEVVLNIDGGTPNSVYGGVSGLNGGTPGGS